MIVEADDRSARKRRASCNTFGGEPRFSWEIPLVLTANLDLSNV
jgi:hypothetical protein